MTIQLASLMCHGASATAAAAASSTAAITDVLRSANLVKSAQWGDVVNHAHRVRIEATMLATPEGARQTHALDLLAS
jgi:hypothetical protein